MFKIVKVFRKYNRFCRYSKILCLRTQFCWLSASLVRMELV